MIPRMANFGEAVSILFRRFLFNNSQVDPDLLASALWAQVSALSDTLLAFCNKPLSVARGRRFVLLGSTWAVREACCPASTVPGYRLATPLCPLGPNTQYNTPA